MLTDNTRCAITLLCEAGGYDTSNFSGHYLKTGDRARISHVLMSHGLLDRNGKLSRPLDTISLYELIVALDDNIHLVEPSQVESRIYHHNDKVSHRLGVLNQVISDLLSTVSISDARSIVERESISGVFRKA